MATGGILLEVQQVIKYCANCTSGEITGLTQSQNSQMCTKEYSTSLGNRLQFVNFTFSLDFIKAFSRAFVSFVIVGWSSMHDHWGPSLKV